MLYSHSGAIIFFNNGVVIEVSYAAITERQNTSLFLKRDEGSGEGKK